MLRLEPSWDLGVLVLFLLLLPLSLLLLPLHRAVNVVHRFRFHSPLDRDRAVVLLRLLPPTPAGNLVPTRVDGEVPADSGSRSSPLRVPPPWVLLLNLVFGILATSMWRVVSTDRAAFRSLQDPLSLVVPDLFLGRHWIVDHPWGLLPRNSYNDVLRGPRTSPTQQEWAREVHSRPTPPEVCKHQC